MNLNPVILAIPMFFTLMAIELVYESITKRKTYRLNDSITNISTGTLQQLTNTFKTLVKIGLYAAVYQYFALFTWQEGWLTFAAAMIGWDFCYYWEHRMAHEVSLFWGGHSVHHQSEEYNLSVALRQTSTGFIWGLPFFLPMAILGIPPEQMVLAGGLNLLYQFWIHTEHINKMPRWFEYLLNTPSHHRVHHGRDPKYLDKNYAGILMVWDRIFGTFKAEEERPHYGTTQPLNSWNPVYANFAHYIHLFKQTKKARTMGDALKMLYKPPGWMPDYLGGYQAVPEVDTNYQKYNRTTNMRINWYIFIQFLAAAVINGFYFFTFKNMEVEVQVAFGIWIVVTTLLFGFLFEVEKSWPTWLEVGRLVAIPVGLFWLMDFGYLVPIWGLVLGAVFAILSVFVLWFLKRGK